jgi:ATP-binding protein involved in chromosome partitioning
MTEQSQLAALTLAVGSGKGGVGKSSVAINLATALAQQHWKVGLLDADLYGPSLPIMLGLRRMPPKKDPSNALKVLPLVKFGVKAISIGMFVEEARSLIWRGPLLSQAISKMIQQVSWGELDILIVDLPPGTGDIQISLSQQLKIHGAIAVTTPQEVAMVDAVKAINSFEQLNIPLAGIIENMAGFRPPGTDTVYPIFGEGKGAVLADRFRTELLGQIPLDPAIRVGGDEGIPVAVQSNEPVRDLFLTLAEKVVEAPLLHSHH